MTNRLSVSEQVTPHSAECRSAFGRKDPTCARCAELINGATPIQWRGVRSKRLAERAELDAIRAHFAPGGPHATGKCGPVCTFGDY